jgi:hypothetical protein
LWTDCVPIIALSRREKYTLWADLAPPCAGHRIVSCAM